MKRFIITTLVVLTLACSKRDLLPASDKKVLFATPSQAEIDLIYSNWQKRDLKPTNYRLVQETALLDGKFTLKLVAYTLAGVKEYGALLIPKTDKSLPVRMLIGGFGLGITTNSVAVVVDNSLANNPFILAIPALRGQSLAVTVNGALYTSPASEGDHCDAFDGATDDTLAFLNLIEQTEAKADVNRTSVRGGSRGGPLRFWPGYETNELNGLLASLAPLIL